MSIKVYLDDEITWKNCDWKSWLPVAYCLHNRIEYAAQRTVLNGSPPGYWILFAYSLTYNAHTHTRGNVYACLRVRERIRVCLLLLSSLKLFALIYYTNNSIFLHGPKMGERSRTMVALHIIRMFFTHWYEMELKPFENGFKLVEHALAFNLITRLRIFCFPGWCSRCILMRFPFSFTFIFIFMLLFLLLLLLFVMF